MFIREKRALTATHTLYIYAAQSYISIRLSARVSVPVALPVCCLSVSVYLRGCRHLSVCTTERQRHRQTETAETDTDRKRQAETDGDRQRQRQNGVCFPPGLPGLDSLSTLVVSCLFPTCPHLPACFGSGSVFGLFRPDCLISLGSFSEVPALSGVVYGLSSVPVQHP